MNPEVKPLGDNALLVNFDQQISPEVLEHVLELQQAIKSKKIKGIEEIVPAYSSLAVFYDPLRASYQELKIILLNLSQQKSETLKINRAKWLIPVCYHNSLAFDLDHYLNEKNISLDKLIKLHTAQDYFVYMRGFLPGFLYLGGLQEQLHLKRKSTPTAKVPGGSVAIGGQQTGIYSFPSPGGWHVIGQTPVKLFDKNDPKIMKIDPGDHIKFYSVSIDDYHVINKKTESGEFILKKRNG